MKRLFYLLLSLSSALMLFSFGASAATAGKVATDGGRLNLRESPSMSGKIITTTSDGSWLTVEGKEGSWYRVSYEGGKTAYAAQEYVKNYPSSVEGTVNVTTGVLNVRTGPGTDYAVKDTIKKGERIIAVKSNSTWAGIVYQGNKTGYVAKAYLKRLGASVISYPSIKLDVPSFKQYDTRWKNYPIGTTGGTIGSIGCLTTAVAMLESHAQGKSITPPEMAKKLSYSSSGSLYWPADYVRNSVSENYMEEIYSLLKKGKPVIIGSRKTTGGQHWVLVYGYEGGSSLTAEKFLIHDPGSEKRNTLQSFFDAYPVKDRLVYKK